MHPGSQQDTNYITMAEDQLHKWIRAGDEPDGSLWDLLCDIAGVDSEAFADMVRYQRSKGNACRQEIVRERPVRVEAA
jgi:hypothetical protein